MQFDKVIDDLRELNFTAIDFELANEKRNSACSLGIVVVRDGTITIKENILIRPKEIRFSEINNSIHRISQSDILNAQEFDTFWPRIKGYIENQIVLAHNLDFDIDVLKQTLKTYELESLPSKFICTQKLAQETLIELKNYRLDDVAKFLNLEHNHHDSLSDATVCAAIGIYCIPKFDKKFYNYISEELTFQIRKANSLEKRSGLDTIYERKRVDSNLLVPNLNVINQDNIFYNKKVVFTGDLKAMSRSVAAERIQNLGADINVAISKKTEIVIMGERAGPSKLKKIEELLDQGYNIRIILENEFLSIINHIQEIH